MMIVMKQDATEEQIQAIKNYESSNLFTPLEKLVLRYAEELTKTAKSSDELVQELKSVGERFSDLLNDQNRKAIADTLEHLSATTAEIDSHAGDLSKTLMSLRTSTETLNQTLLSADHAINSADRTLTTVDRAAGSIQTASDTANLTVQKVGHLADDADKVVNGQSITQFTLLMAQTRALVASVTRLSNGLEREPTRLLFGDQRQGYTPK
jgi:ABC-type transporter Mla subunit MlaD